MKNLKDLDLKYKIFNTKHGSSAIIVHNKKIIRLFLPNKDKYTFLKNINNSYVCKESNLSEFKGLTEDIKRYFSGKKIIFNGTKGLDLSYVTPFQRKVYEATLEIPYGETRTYNWICDRIQNKHSQRAVGGALARNPTPLIIPCHRVIRADGTIGGFSAGSGVSLKKVMIEIEAKSN